MVLYLHVIVIMAHIEKKVLEWTEINGKKYPKKVVYSGAKLPNRNKGNGNLIDTAFNNGNLRVDTKRK